MATYNGHQEDSSGNILLSIGNGMTATLETGSTASQAYTKGAYIFFNNRLCKVTTAISSGATLAIGTNLAQTTVGAELTSHLIASNGDEFYFDYKDGKAGYYPTASKTASSFVPFGGSGEVVQLASVSVSSNTQQTVTLSDSIAKYKFLLISQTITWDGNKFTSSSTSLGAIRSFCLVSYIKDNAITFVSGGSNQVDTTMTVTYVSDSSLTIKKADGSGARNFYFYGVN